MQTKQLGQTDLSIPPVVFGGNVFGWTLDEKESMAMLDHLFELGFTAIDTADVYSRWAEGNSGGESETIIGRWLADRGHRDSITLITKVGHDLGEGRHDLTEKHILEGCDASLRRLQTDSIDLYFSHFDDERTPVEETLGAYEKLVQSGKVRYLGASNFSPDRIKESLATSRDNGIAAYQVLQPEYNLMDRQEFEEEYAPLARDEELGVIAYYSLASGFLSGKYQDKDDLEKSDRGSRVEQYLEDERSPAILKALQEISTRHQVQPAAVALAWVMANPDVTAPIASATQWTHVKAFQRAIELQLADEDLQQLNQASAFRQTA